ncbi:MAG TPA: CHAT domain-containing protein, partial [Thermoanaerobaculia bacterium]
MQGLVSPRSWAFLTAFGALLAACQPAEPPASPRLSREACLEKSFRDLSRWRWVEPRLSGGLTWQPCERGLAAWRGLGEVRCPSGHLPDAAVSFSDEGCDRAGREHVEALRNLLGAERPAAADAAREAERAMETLESRTAQTPSEPRLLSDLAAGYLLRSRRLEQPADLLRSLDAAERAVAGSPDLPEARFNLALAQEALQLRPEAIRSWETYRELDSTSGWAGEADERRRRLTRASARAAATVWPLNRQRLPEVVRAGDRQTLVLLLRPFPAATQRYLEDEVLPGWARELSQGRLEAARRHLALAQVLATELARLTGDAYPADVVRVMAGASGSPGDPAKLRALQEGHLAFGEARLAQQAQKWKVAANLYRQAGLSFSRAGSPLRAGADLGLATALFQNPEEVPLPMVLARLEPLEREAREHRSWYLLGRILSLRAFCLSLLGRHLEALSLYDEAIGRFGQIGDREGVANLRARKAGLLRILGESELAWQEVFRALPDLSRIVDLQSRHYLLGEAATAALALGHPQIALLYQGQAVEMIDQALRASSLEGGDEEVKHLRFNLTVSLRARAAIRAHAELYEEAKEDLDRAMGLAQEPFDENIRRLLQARILEVRGTTELKSDPRRAIRSLTEALRFSPADEYRAFRASLHFQMALAHRELRQEAEAEERLRAGIEELRAEERTILQGRRRGQGEELWTAYFSRSQEAYQLLIQLLAEQGRKVEAFNYAERARAFEPLDLVLRLPFASEAFRRLARNRDPLALAKIQELLPPRTVLIEYRVLADRLLIWIVRHDGIEFLTRPVGRKALADWARTLQKQREQGNVEGFHEQLAMPFPDLVAAPLSRLDRGTIERLVFIPDGPIHGLPLAALYDHATCRPLPARRNGKACRHLIQDFPIAIAPSATLYVYSLIRDRELSR